MCAQHGVRHAVISPGSRSTPLVFAFAQHKDIYCHSVLDERSAAFFATGLARGDESPVVLICTSGTAVGEYLPAIIEAKYQKIPLVVITADRPRELWETGANQTILQENIYSTFVADSFTIDADFADEEDINPIIIRLGMLVVYAQKTLTPVHINVCFNKPLEPFADTGEVFARPEEIIVGDVKLNPPGLPVPPAPKKLSKEKTALISLGPLSGSSDMQFRLLELAEDYNLPVLADAASGISKHHSPNVISHFPLFINNQSLESLRNIGAVIHFGLSHTSSSVEKLLKETQPLLLEVRDFGIPANPLGLEYKRFPETEDSFTVFGKFLKSVSGPALEKLMDELQTFSAKAQEVIFGYTGGIKQHFYTCLNECIPETAFIFTGNSLTARELSSYWAGDKDIPVYHNRGASGIDGLIASAAGLSESINLPGVAILGDLSFFYDLTSLYLVKTNNLNLKIIVMNNSGGGIFHSLPVAQTQEKEIFEDYFLTQQDLSIKELTAGFGIKYLNCSDPKNIKSSLKTLFSDKKPAVLEITSDYKSDKTDAEKIKALINGGVHLS